MPINDREIWVSIVSDKSYPDALHYLTYAIYSFEKYDWFDQIEKQKRKPPSQDELNDWISQITDHRIKGWRESAAKTFDLAAKNYLSDQLARQRQDIINTSIVSNVKDGIDSYKAELRSSLNELKKASSLRNQLGIALLGAIVSPILLGLIILGIQSTDRFWPTPTDITQKLGSKRALPESTRGAPSQ